MKEVKINYVKLPKGNIFSNSIKHFKTICEHRKLVREGCFRVGLYWQGLTHDLSKYSPSEFFVGAKYYQGYRSPNNAEREVKGYSSAWLHHKGRNKHHFEYWIDYTTRSAISETGFIPARMPNRYLVEMYCDRVAASKIYNKGKYTNEYPLIYFRQGKNYTMIEDRTKKEIEYLLQMLANEGEAATDYYIRHNLLRNYPGAILAEVIITIRNRKLQACANGSKKNSRNNSNT